MKENIKVDEFVQQWIAGTNGLHYINKIGTLKDYPCYELPVKEAPQANALMLDIGCSWGRWLIAGEQKNYIPIGLDLVQASVEAAKRVMHQKGVKGYVVAADCSQIPFKKNVFDLVWSFSVLQHVHKSKLLNCLHRINSILANNGIVKIEFPNIDGIRNRFGPVIRERPHWDDKNGMSVRYYSIKEYQEFFKNAFSTNSSFKTHSFLGIGILKEDLKYVSFKNKILVAGSLLLTVLSNVIPGMKYVSDSIYMTAQVKKNDAVYDVKKFLELHHQKVDNLNILPLLCCPLTGKDLILSEDRKRLISEGGYFYPIENDIPILLENRAEKL